MASVSPSASCSVHDLVALAFRVLAIIMVVTIPITSTPLLKGEIMTPVSVPVFPVTSRNHEDMPCRGSQLEFYFYNNTKARCVEGNQQVTPYPLSKTRPAKLFIAYDDKFLIVTATSKKIILFEEEKKEDSAPSVAGGQLGGNWWVVIALSTVIALLLNLLLELKSKL
ncbi:hypothetical protein QCA50_018549 [Cerrena zonata]|uniref:Uncharacterized protein n=1 Tax=Cerrena zonata TaxID=2478898 RepID=A0AAW0FAW8_9APHY